MQWYPPTLKVEAEREIYVLIEKHLRKLPKNANGTIIDHGVELEDNDVDALRHAYVSGVFAQEYNEITADILGRLNEVFPGQGVSASNSVEATNMDLWNNRVGHRKYGKKAKTRDELFKMLLSALEQGELITDLSDQRKFDGEKVVSTSQSELVVVLDEDRNGKNIIFYDAIKSIILTKDEFVVQIKLGNYPGHELRKIGGDEIPVSKRDKSTKNNLG